MSEPFSNLKPKGECGGNQDKCTADECPLYGSPLKPSRDGKVRVRGCQDPSARGKRNKAKGQRKQSKAVTALGIPRSSLRPGHEEHLGGAVRVEVKAGGRIANPVWTRFRDCEAQSEHHRPIGDHRPFAAMFMPDGQSDGLVVVRLSSVHEFAAAILEMADTA